MRPRPPISTKTECAWVRLARHHLGDGDEARLAQLLSDAEDLNVRQILRVRHLLRGRDHQLVAVSPQSQGRTGGVYVYEGVDEMLHFVPAACNGQFHFFCFLFPSRAVRAMPMRGERGPSSS